MCRGVSFPVAAGLFVAVLRLAGTGRHAELQWDARPRGQPTQQGNKKR